MAARRSGEQPAESECVLRPAIGCAGAWLRQRQVDDTFANSIGPRHVSGPETVAVFNSMVFFGDGVSSDGGSSGSGDEKESGGSDNDGDEDGGVECPAALRGKSSILRVPPASVFRCRLRWDSGPHAGGGGIVVGCAGGAVIGSSSFVTRAGSSVGSMFWRSTFGYRVPHSSFGGPAGKKSKLSDDPDAHSAGHDILLVLDYSQRTREGLRANATPEETEESAEYLGGEYDAERGGALFVHWLKKDDGPLELSEFDAAAELELIASGIPLRCAPYIAAYGGSCEVIGEPILSSDGDMVKSAAKR
jgi:hypothetical protein